ncbi:Tex family protein [Nitrincola tapanii]|uniref:RNA-binding transcriptional accessory protein n=1 Tax=Nitrincola tapanii TaxID=1708751 RepID=A0A5A9W5V2_9GAMM|nr:Tex family protein [Nitrincola tapanii]KAA0876180.1 RNA-binding transcriptional accessory protein [Nitrincola tapanii]
MNLDTQLAQELGVKPSQVQATLKLLDDGATVPFIARYRKEATGGLDDTQLRQLEQRLGYLRELNQRREAIFQQLRSQNQLSPELEQALLSADSKARLEDIYLPFRPKRRNKAQEAREAGLEPLALALLASPYTDAKNLAAKCPDPETALLGAREILLEKLSEHADLLSNLRLVLWKQSQLCSQVVRGKKDPQSKFLDYFDYQETLAKVPSHRALAVFRGQAEGVLKVSLAPPAPPGFDPLLSLKRAWKLPTSPLSAWMQETLSLCWSRRLWPMLEKDLLKQLQEQAESEAIEVFARNLRDLLLASPAGARITLGLDPGLRTGTKLAIVDATGKLLAWDTLYPHAPHHRREEALKRLRQLIEHYRVTLIAIGNGTASRETETLVRELLQDPKLKGVSSMLVSEAGASVYSASALAAAEFPDLDVSLRGAVSIARRLQDPLAELVKIDPEAIGVGQYQHDLHPKHLRQRLDAVVVDCVNHVGVDLNTASVALLQRVAGLNETLALSLVNWRDQQGAFQDRKALLKVPRLGPKTFEQCAGFLRIRDGREPLDNTAVHPESYALVKALAKRLGRPLPDILGQNEILQSLKSDPQLLQEWDAYTLQDVLHELAKPGRDPRPEFRSVEFDSRIQSLEDVQPGQRLQGVITNVTPFGAFVDIGVHQDGLIHISQLADHFVKDPHSLVKSGQIVQVSVLEVDLARRRIALSMKTSQS